jgi:hypothetical protein
MERIELNKLLITAINAIILIWLPIWTIWSANQVRKFKAVTFDWWIQVLIVICFGAAINAEIPALWARLVAYYGMNMPIPQYIYVLTTWDRWGHQLFYFIFTLLIWCITKKRIPTIVTDIVD